MPLTSTNYRIEPLDFVRIPLKTAGIVSLLLNSCYSFTTLMQRHVFVAKFQSSSTLLFSESASPMSNGLSDWVVENLDDEAATSTSTTKAGENDSMPKDGLYISNFHILPSLSEVFTPPDSIPIRLLVGRNGWGTGVHPTTRLCLEWLSRDDVIMGGESILDYGCGSGILSIAALGLGASTAVGVDVEAEALVTCQANMDLNECGDRFEGLHTREIVPFCLRHPGADICVANILIGQLVRPSMVSAIVTNLAPRALFCMSGIRPNEVESLKSAYDDHIDWIDEHYDELAASETEGSIESYGFDVGTWARVVGRKKAGSIDLEAMSELAVS